MNRHSHLPHPALIVALCVLAALVAGPGIGAPSDTSNPSIPIRFALREPGFVTIVIDDPQGRRVRNLVSETPFSAGENTVWWDGTDDVGRLQTSINCNFQVLHALVAPGQYRVRSLVRPAIGLQYEFTVYNPGRPAWATADPSSEWLANHTPPSGALFVPEADAKLSPAGDAPGGLVLVCSFVTEGGSGLAWLDLDGHKRFGQHWVGGVWTGATHLARDAGPKRVSGVYAYAGSAWEASAGGGYDGSRSELRLAELLTREAKAAAPRDGRFGVGYDRPLLAPSSPNEGLLPPGAQKLGQLGEDTRYAFPDAAHTGLSGLAIYNARLVAALPKMNQLLWVDAAKRRIIGTAKLADPRGLAFDAQGRLLALSGKHLLRFVVGTNPLALPQPEVLVAGGLQDPVGIALDSAGRIYVSDRGISNQVKVFATDGRPVRVIGRAGVPKLGPYDPLQMHNPNGLTIDSRNQLWVAETDYVPKRVSVWTLDGKLVRAFYGPMEYGGGGAIDPADPTRFDYNGMEFGLDWKTGASAPVANYYQPQSDALGLPSQFRSRAPETAISFGGHRYLTDCYNVSPTNAAESAALWLVDKGVAKPVSALGSANEWPRLAGLFPLNENYSIRWTGQVMPRQSETYTFTTFSDDGVRLWVDGKLIIDNWTPHGTTEDRGAASLLANHRYDIRLEFFQAAGGAAIKLLWSSPSQPREIIPAAYLYPSAKAKLAGGLSGQYFGKRDLTDLRPEQVDPTVDFEWPTSPPKALQSKQASPFANRLPPGTKPGDRLIFTWSDLNGDGKVRPEETSFAKGDAYGVTVMPDLSFVAAYLDGKAVRFAPVGFTGQGAPRYDLTRGTVIATGARKPATSGGGQALIGDDGWTVLTVPPEPFAAQASMSGVRNGQPMWSYPSCWPGLHPSHDAPMPSYPGQLIGTTRLLGGFVKPVGSDLGQVWAINGNKGNAYLFTADGLFVATLFKDCRTASWNAPKAERGMSVADLSQQEECFWPSITQARDGRIYMVTGGNGGSIIRVDGLESARRLPDQTLTVTADQLRAAQEWQVAQELARARQAGPSILRVTMPTTPPAVDGKLDKWPASGFAQIDDRASAALAIAGGRLFAAFRTSDPSLLSNAGESLPLLFKSGGALDLQMDSVAGGLRLLVAQVRGKPVAVLYRSQDPEAKGPPVPFTSPMRTITFGSVRDVSDQVALAADGQGGFELSVPLALLALNPVVGDRLRADVGILRGNGYQTLQRVYWHNKATGVTSDVPSEAELQPELWGQWEFGAGEPPK
jgi:hypothetical protein